jgi:hypothetical protein
MSLEYESKPTFFQRVKQKLTLLSVVTTVVALYRTIFVIVMTIGGAVHTNRYTYWNYIGTTIFYDILWIAYVSNKTNLFKVLTIFVLPIVFGSVFFVCLYIILILQLDEGQLFISATYIDGGTLSVGTVHTFDNIIHTFPVLDFLVILVSGYIKEARFIMTTFSRSLSSRFERITFVAYFFLGPLLPFSLYCIFFNPFEEYPTDVDDLVPLVIGLLIYNLIALWVYTLLTTQTYGHFKKKTLNMSSQ